MKILKELLQDSLSRRDNGKFKWTVQHLHISIIIVFAIIIFLSVSIFSLMINNLQSLRKLKIYFRSICV